MDNTPSTAVNPSESHIVEKANTFNVCVHAIILCLYLILDASVLMGQMQAAQMRADMKKKIKKGGGGGGMTLVFSNKGKSKKKKKKKHSSHHANVSLEDVRAIQDKLSPRGEGDGRGGRRRSSVDGERLNKLYGDQYATGGQKSLRRRRSRFIPGLQSNREEEEGEGEEEAGKNTLQTLAWMNQNLPSLNPAVALTLTLVLTLT